ncbi:MAG: MBL fold metallo-hydrolase [Salinarimonas sp.]|nr:MBL fold metallo-hydrolase [Salinarimonas sp.]
MKPQPNSTPAVVTRFGEATIAGVYDGKRVMPLGDSFVANAPREAVAEALAAGMRPHDTIEIPFTPLLLRLDDRLVLFDTGNGPQAEQTGFGLLLPNLRAIGVAPEDIDTIVISHCHGDHVNGLRDASGQPLFPQAQVMVPRRDLAYWLDADEAARAPEFWQGNFANVRRIFDNPAQPALALLEYEDGDEIAPGVTALAAHGHTPGHMAFRITSGDAAMLLISDAAHLPELFVRHPDWQLMFDMDPDAARETRLRLLGMAAQENLPVAGYHWGLPNIARIRRDGDGFAFSRLPFP